jgi:hypothetical protein
MSFVRLPIPPSAPGYDGQVSSFGQAGGTRTRIHSGRSVPHRSYEPLSPLITIVLSPVGYWSFSLHTDTEGLWVSALFSTLIWCGPTYSRTDTLQRLGEVFDGI